MPDPPRFIFVSVSLPLSSSSPDKYTVTSVRYNQTISAIKSLDPVGFHKTVLLKIYWIDSCLGVGYDWYHLGSCKSVFILVAVSEGTRCDSLITSCGQTATKVKPSHLTFNLLKMPCSFGSQAFICPFPLSKIIQSHCTYSTTLKTSQLSYLVYFNPLFTSLAFVVCFQNTLNWSYIAIVIIIKSLFFIVLFPMSTFRYTPRLPIWLKLCLFLVTLLLINECSINDYQKYIQITDTFTEVFRLLVHIFIHPSEWIFSAKIILRIA